MFPDSLAAPHLADGSFVRVSDVHLDVPLFWQSWKLDSPVGPDCHRCGGVGRRQPASAP
jgi:LysR family transcriptional regulator (chromosome initiation inhibitor)